MRNFFFLFLLITILSSCGSDDGDFEILSSMLVAEGNIGLNNDGFLDRQNTVITTQAQWDSFITTFNNVESDLLSNTNVDFELRSVVVVIDEVRENGDFVISLLPRRNDNSIRIDFQISRQDDLAIDGSTQPFHIISVENVDGRDIFFQEV